MGGGRRLSAKLAAAAAHLLRAIVKTCPSSGVDVTCWNLFSEGGREREGGGGGGGREGREKESENEVRGWRGWGFAVQRVEVHSIESGKRASVEVRGGA